MSCLELVQLQLQWQFPSKNLVWPVLFTPSHTASRKGDQWPFCLESNITHSSKNTGETSEKANMYILKNRNACRRCKVEMLLFSSCLHTNWKGCEKEWNHLQPSSKIRRWAVLLVNSKMLFKSKFWRIIDVLHLEKTKAFAFPCSRVRASSSEAHGNHQYALGKRQASTGQEGTRASTRPSSYWGCFHQVCIYNDLFPSVSI